MAGYNETAPVTAAHNRLGVLLCNLVGGVAHPGLTVGSPS